MYVSCFTYFLFIFPSLKSAVSACPYSPENRSWLQEGEQQSGERRRLNIAGKSFLVDDDGNEVEESRACFVFYRYFSCFRFLALMDQ
jgi:hypothetical protein